MFPAVKEGISASRSEKLNNQGSWSLVLACQVIIYLLLVSVASARELLIKGLFKTIAIPLKYKSLFQIQVWIIARKKITTASFWFVNFFSGPNQEIHYFVKWGIK